MESNRVLKTEDLRKLQLVETGILKAFDSICSKYNIQYFICYGTAIGAIRHRGFIPWDDDIDVGMLRSEYEKLKKVPKSEWGGIASHWLILPMSAMLICGHIQDYIKMELSLSQVTIIMRFQKDVLIQAI